MPRRRSFAGDLDSRSAIDTALHRCDMRFAVGVVRSRVTGQVLYLEAGKDFIDTLLSFLLLPLGTIIHMLPTVGVPQELQPKGAISSLFKSVENLDRELLYVDRNVILAQPRPAANNPSGLSKASTATGLLQLCQDADAAKRPSPPKKKLYLPEQFYKCDNCNFISSKRGSRCYICWPENAPYNSYYHKFREGPYSLSAEEVQKQDDFVAQQQPVEEYNQATGPGFVKENITFMVTDKLKITPSTTSESMSVLKEMKVNSLADLENKKITVNITQVLQLLRSALTSTSCLNDVFGTGETSGASSSSSEMRDTTAKFQELLIPRA